MDIVSNAVTRIVYAPAFSALVIPAPCSKGISPNGDTPLYFPLFYGNESHFFDYCHTGGGTHIIHKYFLQFC